MAVMIPDVDPSQLEHSSESPVYAALRDHLSDEFVVLHSYPWLRPWRGAGTLLEGEADFVLAHQELGLLVLEVKGGETIGRDAKGWFRKTASGRDPMKDPFEQAKRNMHALLDITEERTDGRVSRDSLAYGYAVVFPHMDYEDPPPQNADRGIIICERHLPFINQAIETAYSRWTDQPHPLTFQQFQELVNKCLLPTFRLFRPIGPKISGVSDRLLELTEMQAQVFQGLYAQDRVLVKGVAGSGKTLLALLRAIAFAREGKRTLFVCFNKELAAWIRRQVEEDADTEPFRALLVVRNFHALAAELAAEASIDFRPASGGSLDQSFWDDEVPDLLEQSVLSLDLAGQRVQFDAIVVDEAQDFSLGWWYALTASLLQRPDGPLYAFMDPNQSLRTKAEEPPIDFNVQFGLTINCRNTRKIAAASAAILELEHSLFARAPTGARPRLHRAKTARHQKGLVLEELRRLLERDDVSPSQLAVIGPASKPKGSLADVSEINGVPLVTSADAWRDGSGVLVTTARAFKGLEADAVLLYDLGGFSDIFRKEDLYVACTRAKALLIAIVHADACREVIIAAIAASETQT